MRRFNVMLTATLLIFLAVFSLLPAFWPDRAFSEAENRMLQQKPRLTWDNLISGKFSLAAEKYLDDQFVFRDLWVSVKSATELVLQKKDNNGVYFGKDGYLLQKPAALNEELLAENIACVNRFAESIPARVYFLPAPPRCKFCTTSYRALPNPGRHWSSFI